MYLPNVKKNPWIVVEKSNSGFIYYSTLNLEVAYRYIRAILHLILPDRFCFWFSFHHSSFRYMRTIQTMEEWYHLKKLHVCLFAGVIYFTYCYQISWYTEQKVQRQNSNILFVEVQKDNLDFFCFGHIGYLLENISKRIKWHKIHLTYSCLCCILLFPHHFGRDTRRIDSLQPSFPCFQIAKVTIRI